MIIIYIIITILILSILILVHEFGHFLAARLLGVGVEEFSLGMGPALFKKQTQKTLYAVRAFPIGGYCRLQGEEDESDLDSELEQTTDKNLEGDFFTKPAWVKIIILIAGVTMNFILAFIVLFIASLLSGRDFFNSIITASKTFTDLFGMIFLSFKMLFTGEAGINDLAGPVGMVQMVGELYVYGFVTLLLFMAMLSINLGIINLLPLPALDGGQILLILVEKVKRGEISQKLKERLFLISYILILTLVVVVAFNDFGRIFS